MSAGQFRLYRAADHTKYISGFEYGITHVVEAVADEGESRFALAVRRKARA